MPLPILPVIQRVKESFNNFFVNFFSSSTELAPTGESCKPSVSSFLFGKYWIRHRLTECSPEEMIKAHLIYIGSRWIINWAQEKAAGYSCGPFFNMR